MCDGNLSRSRVVLISVPLLVLNTSSVGGMFLLAGPPMVNREVASPV